MWNNKDTWEEVDVTAWAMVTLEDLLVGVECCVGHTEDRTGDGTGTGTETGERTDAGGTGEDAPSPPSAPPCAPHTLLRITGASNFDGYAQIVHFQGRQRFLFEFSFELTWYAEDHAAPPRAAAPHATSNTRPATASAAAAAAAASDEPTRMKGTLRIGDMCQDVELDSYEVSCPFTKSGDSYDRVRAALLAREGPPAAPCLQYLLVERVRQFQEEMRKLPSQEFLPQVPPGRAPKRVAPPPTDAESAAEAQKFAQAKDILSDPRIRMA